jgi:hypothetical protein
MGLSIFIVFAFYRIAESARADKSGEGIEYEFGDILIKELSCDPAC